MKDRLKGIIDTLQVIHDEWDDTKISDKLCALGGTETLLNLFITRLEIQNKVVTSGIFSDKAKEEN